MGKFIYFLSLVLTLVLGRSAVRDVFRTFSCIRRMDPERAFSLSIRMETTILARPGTKDKGTCFTFRLWLMLQAHSTLLGMQYTKNIHGVCTMLLSSDFGTRINLHGSLCSVMMSLPRYLQQMHR